VKEHLTNPLVSTPAKKKVEASHRRSSPDVIYFTGRKPKSKQTPTHGLPEWMKVDPDYQNLKMSQEEVISRFNRQLTELESAINDNNRDAIDAIADHLCKASESINSAPLMRNAIRIKLIAFSTTMSEIQNLTQEMFSQISTLRANAS
jgi:hypothetical protein